MKNKSSLNKYAIVLIIILIVQYLLGMFTNSFVQFPQGKNEGQLWEFAWSQIPIAAHIIVGSLLLFGAIIFVIRSIRQKNKSWITASIIGGVGILISGMSGAFFISTQQDIYSYLMSIFFLVAFISYGWGLYSSLKHDKA